MIKLQQYNMNCGTIQGMLTNYNIEQDSRKVQYIYVA